MNLKTLEKVNYGIQVLCCLSDDKMIFPRVAAPTANSDYNTYIYINNKHINGL